MTLRTFDIGALIDRQRFSSYQWRIFFLCLMIVLFDGIDTAAIGYIAPAIVRDWGISKVALGPVMSAGLFGLAIGALIAGPLADRIGRKKILLGATMLFGSLNLAAAFATTLEQLTLLRFITGLGLGAAMPNAITIMAEYSPTRRRSLIVSVMFCGFPLGVALGGVLAAWIVPRAGWSGFLLVGGLAPLLLVPLLIIFLPESLRFLVARRQNPAIIGKILASLLPGHAFRPDDQLQLSETRQDTDRSGIRLIVSAPFRFGSAMLWLTYFMGLLIFYLLVNWLPLAIHDSGIDIATSALLTALFPLGGLIGTMITGWLMDRFDQHRILSATYLATALLIFLIGQAIGHQGLLAALICLAGIAMNGAQASMPSFAAAFYPTAGRATGVAWMLGIGRFGGILGTLLGAQLLLMNIGLDLFFGLLAIPALIAAAALMLKRQAMKTNPVMAYRHELAEVPGRH